LERGRIGEYKEGEGKILIIEQNFEKVGSGMFSIWGERRKPKTRELEGVGKTRRSDWIPKREGTFHPRAQSERRKTRN